MSEKLYRSLSELDAPYTPHAPGVPGKVATSARLPGRPIFRLADSAAQGERDANGVAASADVAVDRAASSSGHALPESLRDRFESSLGTDLSGVRVHTGAESAQAASAVGAKAYTTGQDIHFAEGNYNPTDAFGVHLLAHEVAHTVQQQGAPAARQNKLEVSGPADGAELEADRAADAMVSGQPASITSGGTDIARKIETRTNIEQAGDSGASDPAKHGGLGASGSAAQIRVKGKDAARGLASDIGSWQTRVIENKMDDKVSANISVIAQLEDFAKASEVVGVSVGTFKALFDGTKAEYGRLAAMAASPELAGAGLGTPDAKSGDAAAEDHAQAASGGATSGDLTQRASDIASTSGPNGGENKQIKKALDEVKISEQELKASASGVADQQTAATASMSGLNGAEQTLAGIQARSEAQSIKAAYDKAKASYEEAKKSIQDVMGLVVKIPKMIADPEGQMTDLASEVASTIVTEIAVAVLAGAPPDASEEQKAARKQEEADVQAFNGAVNTFNAQRKAVGSAVSKILTSVRTLQTKKLDHERKVKSLGQEFDAADPKQKGKTRKPGEAGTYETIAVFQGQADAFLATADATRQVGERDLTRGGSGAGGAAQPTESAAQSASSKLDGVNALTAYRIDDREVEITEGSSEDSGGSGASAEPGKTIKVSQAYLTTVPVQVESDLQNDQTNHADPSDASGLEGSVQTALSELDGYITQIKAYKTKLSGVMGG